MHLARSVTHRPAGDSNYADEDARTAAAVRQLPLPSVVPSPSFATQSANAIPPPSFVPITSSQAVRDSEPRTSPSRRRVDVFTLCAKGGVFLGVCTGIGTGIVMSSGLSEQHPVAGFLYFGLFGLIIGVVVFGILGLFVGAMLDGIATVSVHDHKRHPSFRRALLCSELPPLACFEQDSYNAYTSTKTTLMELSCKHCGARLSSAPEHAEGDWFIPCFTCGVKNLIAAMVQIVGWRD